MKEENLKQILIIAPQLVGETLSKELTNSEQNYQVKLSIKDLTSQPSIVIWYLDNLESPKTIELEIDKLHNYWKPSPLLIVLPENINISTKNLLDFQCPGLIQAPNLELLKKSINILINGGRIVKIKEGLIDKNTTDDSIISFSQWLFSTGIQQINNDLYTINKILKNSPKNTFLNFIILGRKRELSKAKSLLYLLWGSNLNSNSFIKSYTNLTTLNDNSYFTNIILSSKDSNDIWKLLIDRVSNSLSNDFINNTGRFLALESFNEKCKLNIMKSLIYELDLIISKFISSDNKDNISNEWNILQTKIRQESVRELMGNYLRINYKGEQVILADKLVESLDLNQYDEELPTFDNVINPIVKKESIVFDGEILTPDNPKAIIRIELYIYNWLLRNAEIITAELLNLSSEWPELREIILTSNLISTRELEKFRNQLNSQIQWQTFIKRPIRIYESKREFFKIEDGELIVTTLTETRDEELRNLGWWQQQVALLIEARDAISPQIQTILKHLGDFAVVILTRVIGRAIGLIGKGIAQGMGRGLSKS